MSYQWQLEIFSVLDHNQVSFYDLLIFTLHAQVLVAHSSHHTLLQCHSNEVLDLWPEQFPSESRQWALQVASETYHGEIVKIIQLHAGFHFRSTCMGLEQLKSFSMVDMSKKIKEGAPSLWELLGVLLDADPTHCCAAPKLKKAHVDEDVKISVVFEHLNKLST